MSQSPNTVGIIYAYLVDNPDRTTREISTGTGLKFGTVSSSMKRNGKILTRRPVKKDTGGKLFRYSVAEGSSPPPKWKRQENIVVSEKSYEAYSKFHSPHWREWNEKKRRFVAQARNGFMEYAREMSD